MARITTVLGDIAPEDLGFTSMHDHSVVSLRQAGEYMQQMFSFKDPETLTFIPENYVNIKDGSFLANPELWVTDDVDLLAKEFGFFKALGGSVRARPHAVGHACWYREGAGALPEDRPQFHRRHRLLP